MSGTRNPIVFHFALVISAILVSLLTSSCSKTPDVRLTMCQDLTEFLLDSTSNLQWQEHKPIIKGHDDLEMQISYTLTQADGQTVEETASCFYPYDQDEIGAETFNTPTEAYATYPSKMIFQDQIVAKQQLDSLIQKVMVHQGKETVFKAKQTLDKVEQQTRESMEKIGQKLDKQLDNY